MLREAVVRGEGGFAVARLVVGLATPETESACLETVRGRTLRAVEAIVRAVRECERAGAAVAGARGVDPTPAAPGADEEPDEGRVRVHLSCTPREVRLWHAALELARRMAGESLPVWGCAEWIAAEAASGLGMSEVKAARSEGSPPGAAGPEARESIAPGPGELALPRLGWRAVRPQPPSSIAALACGVDGCSAREIDRRLREVLAFLQQIDLEMGRILRQMVDRRLFRELGCESLERYAAERLDCSPRTARRLVELARLEHRAPPVADAYRTGGLSAFQASTLARVVDHASARAWVERARRMTLRRLEDEADAALARRGRAAIAFHAPRPVAALFLGMVRRAGSLESLLLHAIAAWLDAGSAFEDYADFERDGFRCAVPGCTARRELQSHHIQFLSAGGPDEAWNRITLCAYHHLRGVHAGTVRIRGRAPERLVFELGVELPERFVSGDLRPAEETA